MVSMGSFTSSQLKKEEQFLILPSIDMAGASDIGEITEALADLRKLPVDIQVRLGNWIIYHTTLPGSTTENHRWIDRKAIVAILKHHSILYERDSAEEPGLIGIK